MLSRGQLKIGIKYCGGCSPSYDRIAAAEALREKLKLRGELVQYDDPRAELVVVIMGCSTACAEINGVDSSKLVILKNEQDVINFKI